MKFERSAAVGFIAESPEVHGVQLIIYRWNKQISRGKVTVQSSCDIGGMFDDMLFRMGMYKRHNTLSLLTHWSREW